MGSNVLLQLSIYVLEGFTMLNLCDVLDYQWLVGCGGGGGGLISWFQFVCVCVRLFGVVLVFFGISCVFGMTEDWIQGYFSFFSYYSNPPVLRVADQESQIQSHADIF